MVNVLKKEKQHQQFADQESVRVLDYQQCLRATQTGNDQAVKADCDKVWQEIRSNNKYKCSKNTCNTHNLYFVVFHSFTPIKYK